MRDLYNNETLEGAPRQENSAAINNRLEALKSLSHSILGHINELQRGEELTAQPNLDLAAEVSRYEADLIRCALRRTGGKQRPAARLLNVKVSTLNRKIRRYNMKVEDPDHACI